GPRLLLDRDRSGASDARPAGVSAWCSRTDARMSMRKCERRSSQALIFHRNHGTEFDAVQMDRRHDSEMIAAADLDPALELFPVDIEWNVANVPIVAAGILPGSPFDRTRGR